MTTVSPTRGSFHVDAPVFVCRKKAVILPILQDTPANILSEPVVLENSWSFWFDRYLGPGLTVEEYASSLCNLGSFHSIQNFWRWVNNLPPTCKLGPRTSYHVMKQNVRPLWEDDENVNGGTFTFKVSKAESDAVWLRVLLAIVGEQFSAVLDESDDICGASVSIRKDENIINIWHKNTYAIDKSKVASYIHSLLGDFHVMVPTYKVHQTQNNFKVDFLRPKQSEPLS